MKPFQFLYLLLVLSIASGCGGKKSENNDGDGEDADTNNTQNESVMEKAASSGDDAMDIHDRAMMKIDEAESLKAKLEEKIASTPDIVPEKKKEIENVIMKLNDATESMMDWMHNMASAHQDEAEQMDNSGQAQDIREIEKQIIESIEAAKKFDNATTTDKQ